MQTKRNQGGNQTITLRRWRVVEIEVPDGTRSRHVFGHDSKSGLGRASSPIKEFNQASMTATTRSGSNYKLIGLPGNSRLGQAAWRRWCTSNVVASETDVTEQYLNIDQLSTLDLKRFTTVENLADEH